jgi:hypothetical protein
VEEAEEARHHRFVSLQQRYGRLPSVEKILAVEAQLLRSERIDHAWPGFPTISRDEDHE